MNRTPNIPGAEKVRTLRPTLLLLAVVLVLAGGLFAYSSMFTALRYDVEMTPSRMYAIEGETVHVRMLAINRMGGTVPFSSTPCTVEVTEGAGLVTLEADADSVSWVLRSTGRPGSVALRLSSDAWPFALFAVLHIESPLALLHRTDRRIP